jgi:tellurite resistance protein TerC
MDTMKDTAKLVKRAAIAIVGVTVLLIGVVMIVTPGPALILIPAGLAILGLEFAWARLWLRRIRQRISRQQGERAEHHRRRHSQ